MPLALPPLIYRQLHLKPPSSLPLRLFIDTTNSTAWAILLLLMPSIEISKGNFFETDALVTCIDTCRRKPLVAAGVADGSVIIWNNETNSKQLTKTFPEEPLSVALHPSGLALAIGFSNQCCLYHILVDDLRPFLELPIKNLTNLCFSSGGYVLAVASGSSVSLIDFYKSSKICDIRCPVSKVVSLQWSPSDMEIFTFDEDGNITKWSVDLADGSCEQVCTRRLEQSSSVAIAQSFANATKEQLWALNGGVLECFDSSTLEPCRIVSEAAADEGRITGPLVASVSKDSAMAFVGIAPCDAQQSTANIVRILSVYGENNYTDIAVGPFLLLHTSKDNRFIFLGGTSTGFLAYRIVDKRRKVAASSSLESVECAVKWCDNVLVTEPALEDIADTIETLERDIHDATMEHEFNVRRKENAIVADVENIQAACHREAEEKAEQLHSLEMEIVATELQINRELEEMTCSHQEEIQSLDAVKRSEVLDQVSKCQEAVADAERQSREIEQERRIFDLVLRKKAQDIQAELEKKLQVEADTRQDLENELEELRRDLNIGQEQVEDVLDDEIQTIRAKYRDKLASERDTALQLMSQNGILEKKITAATQRIESNKDKVKSMLTREEDMKARAVALQEQITVLNDKDQGKRSIAEAKNDDIRALQEKRQGYEKAVADLERRSESISAQIEKRQKDAADIDRRSEDLSKEIEHVKDETKRLEGIVEGLQGDIANKQKQRGNLCRKITRQNVHINALLNGLDDSKQLIQRPRELAETISALEDQAVSEWSSVTKAAPTNESESDDAMKERINSLENELSELTARQATAEKEHRRERDALRKTNEALLSQARVAAAPERAGTSTGIDKCNA